jgi:hypothetical protein
LPQFNFFFAKIILNYVDSFCDNTDSRITFKSIKNFISIVNYVVALLESYCFRFDMYLKTNFDQKILSNKVLIILYIISIVGYVLKKTLSNEAKFILTILLLHFII